MTPSQAPTPAPASPAISHPPSPPRRRVVVVSTDGLADRLDHHNHMRGEGEAKVITVTVPNFLTAMGELAARRADGVVGQVAAMAGMVQSTAQALRKLAPKATLVVLGDAQQRDLAEEALAAGFDQWCDPDVGGEQLAEALGVAMPQPVESERSTDEPPSAGNDASPPTPTLDVGDAMAAAVLDDHCRRALRHREGDLHDDAADQADQRDQPQSNGQAADDRGDRRPADQLGDVDLVEAVMAGGDRLPDLAVGLVRHTSDIAGLAWGDKPEAVPEPHAQAPVTFGGFSFGCLHAPAPATQDQLTPWAGWLARWLALDRQSTQLRDLAMRDELTGVYNRRYFDRFLRRVLDRAQDDRQQVTLLVFDIDDFKRYNDRYGHAAGDEVLAESARLMQSVVRDHDVVARIGGDEFAVIFWDPQGPRHAGSRHPEDVVSATRRFQQAVCAHRFPKLLEQTMGTLTISGGLAGFPWDGRTAAELLDAADHMAIASKHQGKNVVTFGPGAKRACGVDQT